MMYSYPSPNERTVKTVTTRQYEYDEAGRVTKETITIEETRYENGQWSNPYLINKTVTDIQPPYKATY